MSEFFGLKEETIKLWLENIKDEYQSKENRYRTGRQMIWDLLEAVYINGVIEGREREREQVSANTK